MQGPETRASLLLRLRDRDQELVWSEFIAIYEPVIYRFARGKGLQDADALDVCQDVFVSVEKSISNFDPERGGTFRGWLFKIARNTLINRLSRDRNTAGSGRTTAMLQLRELPNRDTKLSSEVDEQLRREIFQWAAARVQSRVSQIAWQVFWLRMARAG